MANDEIQEVIEKELAQAYMRLITEHNPIDWLDKRGGEYLAADLRTLVGRDAMAFYAVEQMQALTTANKELQTRLESAEARLTEARSALGRYTYECDICHHARVMHMHDGELGSCDSTECYDPRCERFTNAAADALAKLEADTKTTE